MSKYKRKLNIKWLATTKLGIEELAKNTNFGLTSSDFRLMFYLLSKIDEDNQATIPKQTEISDEINISVRKISEGLSRLKQAKIIIKSEEAKTYFINPSFFYTGGDQVLEDKQKYFDEHCEDKPESYTPTADEAELKRQFGDLP